MRRKYLLVGIIALILFSCATSRRQDYIKMHPNTNQRIKEAILKGDILLGMTEEQVVASRGTPYKVNRTTGKYGVHEQWIMFFDKPSIFDPKSYTYAYIYFENGRVTSWQNY
ncbi:MAG: hypothetical protein HQ555_02355 [Candidatus Aminicenantes bacterium]|nr:hypothetical protein [Candidatus Aminicenantes bacterium]